MSLASGKNISRYSWETIPTTNTVTHRINQLGRGQPKRFIFTDQKGRPIGNFELTGVDGEEAQEELDEYDDLELIDAVAEEFSAQPPELNEPPALEYRPDIRQPVEHYVEPPPLHIHQILLQIQLVLPSRLKFQYLSQFQEYEGPHGLR